MHIHDALMRCKDGVAVRPIGWRTIKYPIPFVAYRPTESSRSFRIVYRNWEGAEFKDEELSLTDDELLGEWEAADLTQVNCLTDVPPPAMIPK
jgi:hypothetical protein